MKKQQKTKKTEVLAPYEKEEPLQWSDVKCTICFSIFIDPVTLPCKHTICLRCFNKFIRETSINCPCCRRRLSTSRSAIKENKLVNHIFYERLKKEFPTKVAARLKEIEKEDAELRSSQDTIDEAGQVKENGLGSGDETDFESCQACAPIVRDGDFSKPGEFGQELRQIYSQHQQDLDRKRQKRALEEENASQSLILELLRQDQLSTQSQLESDLRLARILAEQDNMKPDILPDCPSLLSGNFFTTESRPTKSHWYEQNTSVIPSEGQVKEIPKSKSNGKRKTIKGIAKAPKRRQPLVRNSSTLAVPKTKRPCIRGRPRGASSKNTLDKNQTKIGNYFSPATSTAASSSFSLDCTPTSQNSSGYFSGSNKTLSWTGSPTSQSNITVLNYDPVTESLNEDEELTGPSWWSQRELTKNFDECEQTLNTTKADLKKTRDELETALKIIQEKDATISSQNNMILLLNKQLYEFQVPSDLSTLSSIPLTVNANESESNSNCLAVGRRDNTSPTKPPTVVTKRKRVVANRTKTTCKKCGVYFGRKKLFMEHCKAPCPKKFYPCTAAGCGLKLSSALRLKAHKNSMHSGIVKCNHKDCGVICENKAFLKYHIRTVHGTLTSVQCGICSGFFNTQNHHQRAQHKDSIDPSKVPFTPQELEKFENEIYSLICNKKLLDTKFQNYETSNVLYYDDDGAVGFRAVKENEKKALHYLYHASYTDDSKSPESEGHFVVSSKLSPYTWYLEQLERSRDERNPIPETDTDTRINHCVHTTVATLASQQTNWNSVRPVLAGTTFRLMQKIKRFANSICQVSNLLGTTEALHDIKFWQPQAQQQVEATLASNISLRKDYVICVN